MYPVGHLQPIKYNGTEIRTPMSVITVYGQDDYKRGLPNAPAVR